MKKILILIILLVFTIAGFTRSVKRTVNGNVIKTGNNLTAIKVWGNHYERGYAYGYLLADKIYDLSKNYIQKYFGDKYNKAKELFIAKGNFIISKEYLKEAEGIIAGMKYSGFKKEFDKIDILLTGAFLDVSGLGKSNMKKLGCSSFISWGEATKGTELDGKTIITRHLDWGAPPTIINNFVIVFHIPSEKDEQPWVNIGFAGMISTLSAVNINGVGAFAHVLIDKKHGEAKNGKNYIPIWYAQRSSIEKNDINQDGVNNVLDVRDALLESKNGFGDGFVISAVAPSVLKDSKQIAMIAELAPTKPYHTFRSNSFNKKIPGDNLYTANNEIGRNNIMNYCDRYNTVIKNIGEGKSFNQKSHWEFAKQYSNCSKLGWDNLYLIQFIPENNILKVSVYEDKKQAYDNKPEVFNLKKLL